MFQSNVLAMNKEILTLQYKQLSSEVITKDKSGSFKFPSEFLLKFRSWNQNTELKR